MNQLIRVHSIEEADKLAANQTTFHYLAGGTDLVVQEHLGLDSSECWIDVSAIPELHHIFVSDELIELGAMVTLNEIQSHPKIREFLPVLSEIASSIAGPAIRNKATIGGNLLCENRCIFYNQSAFWRKSAGYCLKCAGPTCLATGGKSECLSKFVSDMAIGFIALDAKVKIHAQGKQRIIPVEELYSGNGKDSKLYPSGLLISILIPVSGNSKSVYKKLRVRKSLDFTSLTTMMTLREDRSLSVVLGGVDPAPLVFRGFLNENSEEELYSFCKKARVVNNDEYSRTYRKAMMRLFIKQSVAEINS